MMMLFIHDMMGSGKPLSRNIDHWYLCLRWGVLKISGYWCHIIVINYGHRHHDFNHLCRLPKSPSKVCLSIIALSSLNVKNNNNHHCHQFWSLQSPGRTSQVFLQSFLPMFTGIISSALSSIMFIVITCADFLSLLAKLYHHHHCIIISQSLSSIMVIVIMMMITWADFPSLLAKLVYWDDIITTVALSSQSSMSKTIIVINYCHHLIIS